MTVVQRTDTFNASVIATVTSIKVLNDIEGKVITLETIPTFGSRDLPESIIKFFGYEVRKVSCPPFILIYEYFEQEDLVVIYDLLHERRAY